MWLHEFSEVSVDRTNFSQSFIIIAQLNISLFKIIIENTSWLKSPNTIQKENNKTCDSYSGLPDNNWNISCLFSWSLRCETSFKFQVNVIVPSYVASFLWNYVELWQKVHHCQQSVTEINGMKIELLCEIWRHYRHFQFVCTALWMNEHSIGSGAPVCFLRNKDRHNPLWKEKSTWSHKSVKHVHCGGYVWRACVQK